MTILLALLQYGKLTGSEIYVYELARELLLLGHKVTIASMATNMSSELVGRLQSHNLKYYQLSDVDYNDFDVIHTNQTNVTEMVRMLAPNKPVVQTVHSEILDTYESPVDGIDHYIAVRPKIYENLVTKYGSEKVTLIYNGIDAGRFYPRPNNGEKCIIFPGTVNYLRAKAFQDVAKYMEDGYKIIYIGGGWKKEGALGNAYFMKPVWDIEKVYTKATMTASIMLGRTTIEGWMMGLPGLIYNINDKGEIISKKIQEPLNDLERYRSDYMTREIVKIYEGVIYALPIL